ncbi:hypothetical protein BKA24_001690 [Microbacterium marinum]|uniref:Uncharacterized protein n=1 Tax=Microbacterium marinum TaxID=421115 RepID=A0A7W7FI28_9MICO|nr:hypothetical protein [Microbacterium marinum]
MSTQLDYSVGIGREVNYGVAVTPTRFVESEAKATYDVQTVKGRGLRPGKGVARSSRHSISRFEGSTDIEIEVPTSGFGMLLNAVMGSVTNTLVSAGLYQQVHTLSKTDPHPTFTIQEVLPTLDGVYTHPHTFAGCAFDSLEISAKEGEYVQAKLSATIRRLLTDVAATAASYPAVDSLFTFVGGEIRVGTATLAAPTTTALATVLGAPKGNVRDASVAVKRNLDSNGYNLGGAGYRVRQPVLGRPEVTGKLTVEYTDNDLRDAYLNQQNLSMLLTFTNGTAALQIALPAIRLKGEVPASNGGEPITQSIDFEAFDNGTAAEPIWITYRTLDTTP